LDLVVTQRNFTDSQFLPKYLKEVGDNREGVGREGRKRVVHKNFTSDKVEENASLMALSKATEHDLVDLISDLLELSRGGFVLEQSSACRCSWKLSTQTLERRVDNVVIEPAIEKAEKIESMQVASLIDRCGRSNSQPVEVAGDSE
jgi:hypothetical protein